MEWDPRKLAPYKAEIEIGSISQEILLSLDIHSGVTFLVTPQKIEGGREGGMSRNCRDSAEEGVDVDI